MKKYLNIQNIPLLTLGMGVFALIFRGLLYIFGSDHKGLLLSWHPLDIMLWVVNIAVLVLIVCFTVPSIGSNRYADNFQASSAGAIGSFAAAAGILITVVGELGKGEGAIHLLWMVLGFLSVPAMILAGLGRLRGKRPLFLLYGLVCLFFAIHMVNQYRNWSSHPQLQDYFFHMCCCIMLMLTAYYDAAFCVGSGRRRMQLATSLLAVYLCCVCLSGGEHLILYATCGAWCFTNLCSLTPVPRRRRPRTEQPPQERPAEGA